MKMTRNECITEQIRLRKELNDIREKCNSATTNEEWFKFRAKEDELKAEFKRIGKLNPSI